MTETSQQSRSSAPDAGRAAGLRASAATTETLEDYTLRFAPRTYRSWSTGVVAVSALGGIAYLADFAIGANIGIAYGTANALWGILVFAVVIFASGWPLAYYAARYNLDLDLITRGSGFGYYGSVVTDERPDMAACATHDAVVCSLCLSTDKVGDHVLPAQAAGH